MPRKEKYDFMQFHPNFFFFFYYNMLYGNDIIQQACKARSNWCKLDVANTEKQSPDLLFLSSPDSTCNILSKEIGANNIGSKIAHQV